MASGSNGRGSRRQATGKRTAAKGRKPKRGGSGKRIMNRNNIGLRATQRGKTNSVMPF